MRRTTSRSWTALVLGLISISVIGSVPRPSLAAQGPDRARPTILESIEHRSSRPLRELPPIPPRAGELFELPRKLLPNREGSSGPSGLDPLLQPVGDFLAMPATDQNFEGLNNVNGVLPPDTNGDVGPNHYVQIVNLSFAIWDKSGNLLYGPANTNTLWQAGGGVCATNNNGDPIVLYDHLADRWLISQFALPNFWLLGLGPFYQCIAISQTPDPTGAYHLYTFQISNTKLNDYPKFGVWPDGYYMAMNQFNQLTLSWAGQGVVAFERDKMLQGVTARGVLFDMYNTDQDLGGLLPADLDGPIPPAGAPNPFVLVDDDGWGYSPDQLQIWNFH
ncbi:MAG TPA: hypothetical protein VI520_06300, partial [Anaerolineales bacterium]|nr:hypothetical protein [Anaerolineales bacterium]